MPASATGFSYTTGGVGGLVGARFDGGCNFFLSQDVNSVKKNNTQQTVSPDLHFMKQDLMFSQIKTIPGENRSQSHDHVHIGYSELPDNMNM